MSPPLLPVRTKLLRAGDTCRAPVLCGDTTCSQRYWLCSLQALEVGLVASQCIAPITYVRRCDSVSESLATTAFCKLL